MGVLHSRAIEKAFHSLGAPPGGRQMNRSIIFLLLGASVAAAVGQILFRLGARDRISLLAFVNPYIALGMLFYALGMAAWIYALSREQMVAVYGFHSLDFRPRLSWRRVPSWRAHKYNEIDGRRLGYRGFILSHQQLSSPAPSSQRGGNATIEASRRPPCSPCARRS
jgi:hypothetical protein